MENMFVLSSKTTNKAWTGKPKPNINMCTGIGARNLTKYGTNDDDVLGPCFGFGRLGDHLNDVLDVRGCDDGCSSWFAR